MFALTVIIIAIVTVYSSSSVIAEECPEIINRAQWGARPALSTEVLAENPAPFVIVHHSATPGCLNKMLCKVRVQNIQEYHMTTRRWDDIGYNFMIGGEGTIFEGRGWGLSGAHAKGWNSRSIGICLIGNLQDKNPTATQLMALEALILCGEENGHISKNYSLIGHRQAVKTDCPGNKMFRIVRNMPNFNSNPKK